MKKQNHLQIVILLLIILSIAWFLTSNKKRESNSAQNSKNKVENESEQKSSMLESREKNNKEKNFSSQNTNPTEVNKNPHSTHSLSGPAIAPNPNEGNPIASPPPVIGPTGKMSGTEGPLSPAEDSKTGPQAVKGPHQH